MNFLQIMFSTFFFLLWRNVIQTSVTASWFRWTCYKKKLCRLLSLTDSSSDDIKKKRACWHSDVAGGLLVGVWCGRKVDPWFPRRVFSRRGQRTMEDFQKALWQKLVWRDGLCRHRPSGGKHFLRKKSLSVCLYSAVIFQLVSVGWEMVLSN